MDRLTTQSVMVGGAGAAGANAGLSYLQIYGSILSMVLAVVTCTIVVASFVVDQRRKQRQERRDIEEHYKVMGVEFSDAPKDHTTE